MVALIAWVEAALVAPPGALWALVESHHLRGATDIVFTEDVRLAMKVVGLNPDFLPPDWHTLAHERKHDVIDWIQSSVIEATPARRMSRLGYDEHEPSPDLLKLLKRSMYGRAKLDLLRRRFLLAG